MEIDNILSKVRFERPYGKVVEMVFRTGSTKAAARQLGWSESETIRQFRLGIPAIVKVVNQSTNVG